MDKSAAFKALAHLEYIGCTLCVCPCVAGFAVLVLSRGLLGRCLGPAGAALTLRDQGAGVVVVVVVVVVGPELDDLAVFGLEVEREMAALPSKSAQLALQRPAKVLDLVAVVNGQKVAAHFWVLRL